MLNIFEVESGGPNEDKLAKLDKITLAPIVHWYYSSLGTQNPVSIFGVIYDYAICYDKHEGSVSRNGNFWINFKKLVILSMTTQIQCDQMALLFVNIWAICNSEKLPNCVKLCRIRFKFLHKLLMKPQKWPYTL